MAWIAIDKWGTRLASLATLVVLGRLLAPADFGLVALAATFMALATVFVDYGFSKAVIQRRELNPEHLDTAFWISIALGLAFTVITIAAAPAIAAMMDMPALAPILRGLGLGLVIGAVSATPAALLERNFQFKALAVRRLTSTVAGSIAAIAVALAGGGVWSLVVQTLVTSVVAVIALWFSVDWRPGLRFRKSALQDLWPIGGAVFGIELVAFVNSQADRLLVGIFMDAQALGYYYMAVRLVSIMLELFSSIFSSISLTMFSRLQDDADRLRHWFLRLTAASSIISLPCFALTAALAPVLIPLVLGEQWSESILLFQILTFLGAINAVAYFDRSLLLALGRGRMALGLTLGQGVLGVILILAAVSFGTIAVAIAVVARQYLYWPVRLIILKHIAGIRPWAYLVQWLRPFVASVLSIALLLLVTWQWPHLTEHRIAYMLGAGLTGLAIYLLVLRWLQPQAFTDMRQAFDTLRRRKTEGGRGD